VIIERHNALPGPRARGKAWLQKTIIVVLGISLAVVAFFFIAIALVAGACLALGVAVRWWWVMRRLSAAHKAAGPLEGQYAVIEESRDDRRVR
jgi:hypothetical protein